MDIKSLEEYLAPMSPREFLKDFYGKKPAHISGRSGRFAKLIPWEELNSIIARHRLAAPRLRLAKEGSIIEESTYARQISPYESHFNLSNLNTLFREGATLVFDGLDETYQPITELCRMLERSLGEYVYTNAYAGWYTGQGFTTHWDNQDVIITQVSGRKHWRVFEPDKKHPVDEYNSKSYKPPAGSPAWEGDLNSGDLLYIPRGWPHDAVPVGEPTIHLTVTIIRRNGLSLMAAISKELREYESIRADLPRFASPDEQTQYMAEFRSTVTNVMQKMTVEKYFRNFDSMAPARVRPSFPWSAMPECQPLAQDAWLHWLPPRKLPIEEKDGKIVLEAIGSKFTFEKVAEPVLRNLADDLSIRMDRLCLNHPEVAPEAMAKFVLDLAGKGLIAIAQNEHI